MTKKKICVIMLLLNVLLLLLMPIREEIRTGVIGVFSNQEEIVQINIDNNSMKIAITFDDGPDERYTMKLLDGLKERGVHATFFVIGANAKEHPEVVKRIYDEGHIIGNHTYNHVKLTEVGYDEFANEIITTNELIEEIIGQETDFIRPPFGAWDKRLEEELGMIPVMWNIDPRDWCSSDVNAIVNRVVNGAKDDGIIILHDNYDTSVDAAFQIIDRLKAEGYEFVTVDELILD